MAFDSGLDFEPQVKFNVAFGLGFEFDFDVQCCAELGLVR